MKLFKKAKKGFTLVELVVVIAVIAILAAVSVGAYFGVTESAKNSQVDQEAKSVHTSIMLIANDPKYTDVSMDDAGLTYDEDTIGGYLTEVTSLTYVINPAESNTTYPAITFIGGNDADTKAEQFKYAIDADHSYTYNIVTGAKVA